MFTGLVEAVGKVGKISKGDGVYLLSVISPDIAPALGLGQSVAVSGACLTVCDFSDRSFTVDITDETMSKTKFATLKPGREVNLERALCLSSRLDGHMVTGHVDGVVEVIDKKILGQSLWLSLKVPQDLRKYLATKGSICLDGVSLTVAEKNGDRIGVALIPTTIHGTTLRNVAVGEILNLEVDIIARYLECLIGPDKEQAKSDKEGLSMARLREMGW